MATKEEFQALEDLNFPTILDNTDQAKRLIRGLQLEDPKLYECIMMLCNQISQTTTAISPIVITIRARVPIGVTLLPPIDFTHVVTKRTIRLSWTRPAIAGIFSYEIRFGSSWDTAQFILRTQSILVDVVPFQGLTGTFRIKTLNDLGEYSADEATTNVIIIPPGPVVITGQVIDNNILLQWTEPLTGSYEIDYYEIWKANILQGYIEGNFVSTFEVVAGSYTYTIIPYDIAGNVGASASIELLVNQPPDYVLQDEYISSFNGTKVNCVKIDGPSLVASAAPETWEFHYSSRSWDSPQEQIDAGYPIYAQPTAFTGSYEEIVDFEVVLKNVIATIRFNVEKLIEEGTILIIIKMAVSDDGITYTPFVDGASQFLPSLRFLKFRLEFTADLDTVLIRIFNLFVNLAVKRENDGGEIVASAADNLGTQVNFTKVFKDVESVTATIRTPQEPYTVVVDFQDVSNPVGFKVFVFDSTGNRVSKTVEWKARGVV